MYQQRMKKHIAIESKCVSNIFFLGKPLETERRALLVEPVSSQEIPSKPESSFERAFFFFCFGKQTKLISFQVNLKTRVAY